MVCEEYCLGQMVHTEGPECCHTCTYFGGEACAAPGAGYFPKHFRRYVFI